MRQALKIAAWNAGLLVLLILGAELIFGNWFAAPGLWNLGVFRNVAWTIDATPFYERSGPVIYKRDYFGLRGAYGRPEDINLLALGGSTTDQRNVSEGETWPDVLGACLQKKKNLSLNVANAGVSGQSTRGHAANFDLWFNHIPGLKPRWVVALIGVNENALEGRVDNDDVGRFTEGAKSPSAWQNFSSWVRLNSALLRLISTVRGNLKAMKAGIHPLSAEKLSAKERGDLAIDRMLAEAEAKAVPLEGDELASLLGQTRKDMAGELDAMKGRLAVLAAKIEAFGAKPVFVTQNAANYRMAQGKVWGDLRNYARMRLFSEGIMAFCREKGLVCLDQASSLSFEDGDAYDSVHTTAKGSRRIGEWICERLELP
jgi:lysophospholipase L1-like esterase